MVSEYCEHNWGPRNIARHTCGTRHVRTRAACFFTNRATITTVTHGRIYHLSTVSIPNVLFLQTHRPLQQRHLDKLLRFKLRSHRRNLLLLLHNQWSEIIARTVQIAETARLSLRRQAGRAKVFLSEAEEEVLLQVVLLQVQRPHKQFLQQLK